MSLLTVAAARAVITTGLSDSALQDVIDREEAWLARRIGLLTGERTETFPLAGYRRRQYEVRLQRPTDVAGLTEVTDYGVVITNVELTNNGWRVAVILGASYFTGPVTVEYTPTDELEVIRVLIDLVRLQIVVISGDVTPGLQSETIGDYSYTLGDGAASAYSTRRVLVKSLQEPSEPGTIPIRVASPARVTPVIEVGW
jgi:hypothetical protein